MIHPILDGIDLVVFDKDGTLLDFHAMWGGWARELAARLEGSVRRPVGPDVFAALGFDPASGRIAPGGPLAASTMAGIADLLATLMRRWCPNVAAARRAVETAWFEPDPVADSVPLADLAAVFGALRASGRRVAVATNDDRAPTDATLVGLGVRGLVDAIAAADDIPAVKPAPDALLLLGAFLRVPPARVAMVGDLPVDLAMARAAGARAIGVRSGLGGLADLEPMANGIIGSVADLVTPSA